MNNLPKVVTRQHGGRGSNSRPPSHDNLAARLSSYPSRMLKIKRCPVSQKINYYFHLMAVLPASSLGPPTPLNGIFNKLDDFPVQNNQYQCMNT